MDITKVSKLAIEFNQKLNDIKHELDKPTFWYPYGTLNNFIHLEGLLTGKNKSIFEQVIGNRVADIGAADGDLAFFLESLGSTVDILDYGKTNFNGLQGARKIKKHLNSSVNIIEIDLDSYFHLDYNYDLVFFLGILYHLKNPFYIMERLANHAKYCLVSTRTAKLTTDRSINFSNIPIAYLLDTTESNNDLTNYWIFSKLGLERLLKRTGWEIVDLVELGCVEDSDPASMDRDERTFALLQSRNFN
jgi:tRNA (mo5U34)-methyltransferase